MKKIYKAHILYTKERSRFEVLENGYVAVDADGCVTGVAADLAPLDCQDAEVVDFGDCLLIPAMNDLHVHAPQYRNQGIAMDLELLPWLQNYTFPEEMKYADTAYAERMYRRFVRDLWRFGTMRACVFATIHTESTRLLMRLFQGAGMGAQVGKVAMNRNCPEALSESVEACTQGYERLLSSYSPETNLTPHSSPSWGRPGGVFLSFAPSSPLASFLLVHLRCCAPVASWQPSTSCPYSPTSLRTKTSVWTEGEELELMKRRGVIVAHCPTSNFNVASGMAPIRKFLDEGLRVGLGSDISGGHDLNIFRMMVYAIQVSKMHYQQQHERPFLTLSEAFWMATKSAGSFFGRVGSFEPGYEFDALVIDDSDLNHDNYSLLERMERYIYLGDDRQIIHRFCRGSRLSPPPVGGRPGGGF